MLIDGIGNYYGGLDIKEDNGKYFWGIENYNGTHYEEISEELFRCIEIEKFKT